MFFNMFSFPFSADVILKINHNMRTGKTTIKTNARKEALEEILDAWLTGQMGQGEDKNPPHIRESYMIKIELDLRTDRFRTRSNTGNEGLTCGIIMGVRKQLGLKSREIEVTPL